MSDKSNTRGPACVSISSGDVNGTVRCPICEGPLEKNAEDVKSGAGQYFTPRVLIRAIVEVMVPAPGVTINDPACGTGVFLLAAHDYISSHFKLERDQKTFLKEKALSGKDIVDSVARSCVMNMFLHGIGGRESPIEVGDSLMSDPGKRYDPHKSAVRKKELNHDSEWRGED